MQTNKFFKIMQHDDTIQVTPLPNIPDPGILYQLDELRGLVDKIGGFGKDYELNSMSQRKMWKPSDCGPIVDINWYK